MKIFLELETNSCRRVCGYWSGVSFFITNKKKAHLFKNRDLAEITAKSLEKMEISGVLVKNSRVCI